MPNWTESHIRLNGERENVEAVLKLIIVDDEYIKKVKKEKFDLCKHIKAHANYTTADKKVCDCCDHCTFCPLLSPKEKVSDWKKAKISDYGHGELTKGSVDFNILVPQPKAMFQGGTNDNIRKRNARFDIADWYDWNIANWGTKWNPDPETVTVDWIDDYTVEITMQTAWNLPEAWLNKLADECKKRNVSIEGEYADEDFGSDMGRFRTSDDGFTITHDTMDKDIYERVWGEDALEDDE